MGRYGLAADSDWWAVLKTFLFDGKDSENGEETSGSIKCGEFLN
jgi:hypothetical protein